MSDRAKKKPVFNKWQRWILDNYQGGEMSYCQTEKDINCCGDGLLKFLVVEMANIEGCNSPSDVSRRIDAAIRGLQELAAAPIEKIASGEPITVHLQEVSMENKEYDEICSVLVEKGRHDLVEKLISIVGKNNALTIRDRELNEQLQHGRDYLMSVDAKKINVEDALEAFGFGRNGLFYGV